MKLIIKYIIRGYAKLVTVSYFQQRFVKRNEEIHQKLLT